MMALFEVNESYKHNQLNILDELFEAGFNSSTLLVCGWLRCHLGSR
jgi:hypothetical protein